MSVARSLKFPFILSVVLAITIVVFTLVGVLLGMRYTPRTSPQQDKVIAVPNVSKEAKKGHPKLSSVLNQLLESDNYDQFARTHGLAVKDNTMKVTITVVDTTYQLPSGFGTETARYQNKLDAYVRLDRLLELADDFGIRNIDVPSQPIAL